MVKGNKMITITDEEYKEYQRLKDNALIQRKFDAIKEVKYLENDIDVPIKLIVSMLTLLSCKTRFSCCGFDYDGQPFHKTHEYGVAYVQMKEDICSDIVMKTLYENKYIVKGQNEKKNQGKWRWNTRNGIIYLESEFNKEYDNIWGTKRTCVHYSERGALAIDYLERALWTLRKYFVDSVTIYDSNKRIKDVVHSWQYPALEPWTIEKKTVIEQYNALHKKESEWST